MTRRCCLFADGGDGGYVFEYDQSRGRVQLMKLGNRAWTLKIFVWFLYSNVFLFTL